MLLGLTGMAPPVPAVGPYNVKDADTTPPTITAGTVEMVAQMLIPRRLMQVVSGLTSTKLSREALS